MRQQKRGRKADLQKQTEEAKVRTEDEEENENGAEWPRQSSFGELGG
jgi:hypothetical protein